MNQVKPYSIWKEVESESESHSVVSNLQSIDSNPPGSSDHEILQARILEWVNIAFFRGSSLPRDRTHVSRIAEAFFTS